MRAPLGPSSLYRLWPLLRLLLLVWPWPAIAQQAGLITMIEGPPPLLIREATLHSAARGVAVKKGDILETAAGGFAQLEFADQTIVALGPDSRLFVFDCPASEGDRKHAPQLVLLRGWLKTETPAQDPAENGRYWLGGLTMAARPGSTVAHVAPAETRLFVETGTADIAPAEKPRAPATVAKAGQFVSRARAAAPLLRNGLPAAFIAEMPRAFQDTLPPQAPRLRQPAAAPKPERAVNYEDVADVLSLPVGFRVGFIRRFENRLSDSAFRRAVDANMRRHPEWDRVLHPEKYETSPRTVTDSRRGRPGQSQ